MITVALAVFLLAACEARQQAAPPVTGSSATPSSPTDDTAVVAVTALGKPITYRNVRCQPEFRADPQKCREVEQTKLAMRLLPRAIDEGAAMNGIELSDSEKASIEAKVAAAAPHDRQAADVLRAAIAAAARVHAGEPRARVAADAATAGVGAVMLDQMVSEYRSEAEARAALNRDYFTGLQLSLRENLTRELIAPRLRAFIEKRATTTGTTYAESEARLWRELAASGRIRITDKRYQLPNFTGALEPNEITIEVPR